MAHAGGRGFQPIAELGRGGMSRVFLAFGDESAGMPKLVVSKVLLPELASSSEFVDMFFEEARLSARLEHENVIRVFRCESTGDEPYMLMEFLDGGSLDSLVRRSRNAGGIPRPLHLRMIERAARGLHYAHELKDESGEPLRLVHRDVSPHNVHVTFDGVVKVLDFGIAKAADSTHTTKTGVLKGKFAYMSPEQIKNSKKVDRRADIFALGVMLWQAATNRRIWAGLTEIQMVERLVSGEIPPPVNEKEPIDAELGAIITRSLEADREKRYATAADLADALDAYLAKLDADTTPAALAAFVTKLMADRREKVQAVVEAATKALASKDANTVPPGTNLASVASATGSVPAFTPTPLSMSSVSLSQARGSYSDVSSHGQTGARGQTGTSPGADRLSSASLTAGTVARPPPPARRGGPSLTGVLVVLVAVLAGGVIAALALGGRGPARVEPTVVTSAHDPAASSSATASAAPPPESSLIELSLSATPSSARFLIDGTPLAGNPTRVKFPRDGREHEIRAEAAGYKPGSQRITYDEEMKSITMVLARKR